MAKPKRLATAILNSEQLLAEIRDGVAKLGRTEQSLAEIREGIANLGRTEQLLSDIRDELAKQSRVQQTLSEIRDGISNQTDVINRRLAEIARSPSSTQAGTEGRSRATSDDRRLELRNRGLAAQTPSETSERHDENRKQPGPNAERRKAAVAAFLAQRDRDDSEGRS